MTKPAPEEWRPLARLAEEMGMKLYSLKRSLVSNGFVPMKNVRINGRLVDAISITDAERWKSERNTVIPGRLTITDKPWNPVNLPDRPRRGRGPIQMDTTPVPMRGEELHPIWWRGRQWAVTSYGVEALDGTYAFEAERLTEGIGTDGCWPAHMSVKNWVDRDDFFTAWLVALVMHGADGGKVRRCIAMGRKVPIDE